MERIKLSVIIPAFNEAENIKKGSLKKVWEYISKQRYPYEVVIVDDGSKDETVSLIEAEMRGKNNFRLIKNTHGGKAITVITGLLASRGEIAFFTDMDQATPIKEIEKFIPVFDEGYDIVIGSRHGRKGAPLIRKLMAWGFAALRNLILQLPFSDTQCGFKAFKREAIEKVFPTLLNRWESIKAQGAAVNAGFDVETLFLAKKRDLKIAEVSVEWHHVGTERVQMVRDSVDAVKDMIRIKINDFRGVYV